MAETVQENWENYALLGKEKVEENQLEEAIANYEKAIELGCDKSWVYIKLGDVYSEVGQFELALERVEKAIAWDEKNVWGYVAAAQVLRKEGKIQEALEKCEAGLEVSPGQEDLELLKQSLQEEPAASWVSFAVQAKKKAEAGERQAAIRFYERSISLNPDEAWPYIKLAELISRDKKLELYEKAIEIESENPWGYIEAIRLLQEDNQLEKALEKCEDGLSIHPDNENLIYLKQQIKGDESPVRLIAFFLPQYHPIPENDEWWGKGFTEWTNVTKAKPLFEGHYQPRLPTDLGFYDLRLPEVRELQAELAKQYGIYGFCYYYYWFAGKRLLDRPLDEILQSQQPDFPFCLCWANENWSRRWDGSDNEILIAQEHTVENDRAFAESVVPYLQDERYIRINGKPLLIIYRANVLPDVTKTIEHWRDVFREKGVGEVYLCAALTFGLQDGVSLGFDAEVEFPPNTGIQRDEIDASELNIEDFGGKVYDYQSLALNTIKQPMLEKTRFSSVMLSWDNTARKKKNAHIYHNFSFDTYEFWLKSSIQKSKINYSGDERLVFINAWNEWAEGSYLEPDQVNGHQYLESTRKSLVSQEDWKIYVSLLQSFKGNDYGKLEKILTNLYESLVKHGSNIELIVDALEKQKLVFEKLSKLDDASLEWTLEHPAIGESLPSNFTISGWVVSKELQPIALEIVQEGLILKQIPVDGFRQDVKDYFHDYQSNNNYYSGTLRLSSLKSLASNQVEISINVVYENGDSSTLGLLHFNRESQNLSTLKNLPNLSESCHSLIINIERFLQNSKPVLFILHDIAAAGAQLFLVRQLEWISQNCGDIRFQVLVNIDKNCILDYGEGGKQILETLEKICPVYFLNGATGLPENISHLQSNYYSLIYVNTSVLGDLLESIGKIKAQVIVHIHELYFWIKYRMGIEKFNKYFKYNPKFIACSNAVKDNLIDNLNVNPAQIEVIHAYVPVDKLIQNKTKSRAKIRQELNLTEDTFVIASCGTLDWRKGADLLVPLVVLLKEKLPHQKFVYLWVGGFISELAESEMDFMIKKAGLEQDILLLGHQTNPINYLNAADVFALLSKEDPFPLVMSEAAVCQLPTVGFEGSGGVSEFVESDAGLLAPYLNIEVMAEHIKTFHDNPKLRKELGENACRKINTLYNETVLAPKVVQLIQSLIEASYPTPV